MGKGDVVKKPLTKLDLLAACFYWVVTVMCIVGMIILEKSTETFDETQRQASVHVEKTRKQRAKLRLVQMEAEGTLKLDRKAEHVLTNGYDWAKRPREEQENIINLLNIAWDYYDFQIKDKETMAPLVKFSKSSGTELLDISAFVRR